MEASRCLVLSQIRKKCHKTLVEKNVSYEGQIKTFKQVRV